MFNVCSNCGEYRVDKVIKQNDKNDSYATCPVCGHPHKFLQLPLFIVTGASGAGKSTIVLQLSYLTKDVVVMETDILWDNRYNQPETNYRDYREVWLRMAKNIAQAGKPVILCGTAMPDQLEPRIERRYFTELHYIALVCENDLLEMRLKSRPSWRGSNSEDFINGMISYNNFLKENASKNFPKIDILDTSKETSNETAQKLYSWIRDKYTSMAQ